MPLFVVELRERISVANRGSLERSYTSLMDTRRTVMRSSAVVVLLLQLLAVEDDDALTDDDRCHRGRQ